MVEGDVQFEAERDFSSVKQNISTDVRRCKECQDPAVKGSPLCAFHNKEYDRIQKGMAVYAGNEERKAPGGWRGMFGADEKQNEEVKEEVKKEASPDPENQPDEEDQPKKMIPIKRVPY